jgi:hypothetical protein
MNIEDKVQSRRCPDPVGVNTTSTRATRIVGKD